MTAPILVPRTATNLRPAQGISKGKVAFLCIDRLSGPILGKVHSRRSQRQIIRRFAIGGGPVSPCLCGKNPGY